MEMKLYAFSVGTMTVKKGIFASGKEGDKKIKVPVECFLIVHPKGTVLFDTGIGVEVGLDPEGCWGSAAKAFQPSICESEDLVTQLRSVGYSYKDIGYVVLSHMHMDHVGCLRWFGYSNILVQDAEMKLAQKAKAERNGYYRRDWDYPFIYNRPVSYTSD